MKLQTDAEARETRMAEMERALQSHTISDRLETAKDHGTIGELVKQVAALTETVKNLQIALASKDKHIKRQNRIISELRGSQKAPSEQETPTIVDVVEPQNQMEIAASQTSSEDSVDERVSNWISSVPAKNKQKPMHDKTNADNMSDHSITSTKSKATGTSNATQNSNLPKRGHSGSDYSCLSGNSNASTHTKRKHKHRKKGGKTKQ